MSLQAFVILLTRVTILRFLKIALKKAGKKKKDFVLTSIYKMLLNF